MVNCYQHKILVQGFYSYFQVFRIYRENCHLLEINNFMDRKLMACNFH